MIDSVGGSGMPMPSQRMQQSLSGDQLALVKKTLAQYDLENLTEDDAQAIVNTFAEAGIRPGQALEQAMAAEGEDAREVGELAGVKGPQGNRPPPPPPGGPGATEAESLSISSLVVYLEEMLADKDLDELTNADKQDIYSQLIEHFGLPYGESLINITV